MISQAFPVARTHSIYIYIYICIYLDHIVPFLQLLESNQRLHVLILPKLKLLNKYIHLTLLRKIIIPLGVQLVSQIPLQPIPHFQYHHLSQNPKTPSHPYALTMHPPHSVTKRKRSCKTKTQLKKGMDFPYLTDKAPFLELLESNQSTQNEVSGESLVLRTEHWNSRTHLLNFLHHSPPLPLLSFISCVSEHFNFLPPLHKLSWRQHGHHLQCSDHGAFGFGENWAEWNWVYGGVSEVEGLGENGVVSEGRVPNHHLLSLVSVSG